VSEPWTASEIVEHIELAISGEEKDWVKAHGGDKGSLKKMTLKDRYAELCTPPGQSKQNPEGNLDEYGLGF
jgi:hypothetical protein